MVARNNITRTEEFQDLATSCRTLVSRSWGPYWSIRHRPSPPRLAGRPERGCLLPDAPRPPFLPCRCLSKSSSLSSSWESAVFLAMRPYCARFIEAQDYTRRRNLWIALTVIAFLSPSFWILFSALAFRC